MGDSWKLNLLPPRTLGKQPMRRTLINKAYFNTENILVWIGFTKSFHFRSQIQKAVLEQAYPIRLEYKGLIFRNNIQDSILTSDYLVKCEYNPTWSFLCSADWCVGSWWVVGGPVLLLCCTGTMKGSATSVMVSNVCFSLPRSLPDVYLNLWPSYTKIYIYRTKQKKSCLTAVSARFWHVWKENVF